MDEERKKGGKVIGSEQIQYYKKIKAFKLKAKKERENVKDTKESNHRVEKN